METIDEKIIYKLDKGNDNIEMVLQEATNSLISKLKKEIGEEYKISSDEFESPDKDWSHEIKIRKGNKIGADIGLRWENKSTLEIDINKSSKIGSIITYGVSIPLMVIGAYMGYNNIAPLAFLPGSKIAAGLGGLISLIPSFIIINILKSLLLKEVKEEANQLVINIRKILSA